MTLTESARRKRDRNPCQHHGQTARQKQKTLGTAQSTSDTGLPFLHCDCALPILELWL